MTRSYYWLALVSMLLLLLQLTLGELQRTAAAAAANPIGKAPGGSSTPPERSERIRAHLAGGFIDDAMAHKNGAPQRHAYGSDVDHRRPHAAGSGRKMGTVRGTSGPIHTYIKTDKNANFKWGVRHFVGAKYAR